MRLIRSSSTSLRSGVAGFSVSAGFSMTGKDQTSAAMATKSAFSAQPLHSLPLSARMALSSLIFMVLKFGISRPSSAAHRGAARSAMNANTSHLRMMRDRAVGSVELFSRMCKNEHVVHEIRQASLSLLTTGGA